MNQIVHSDWGPIPFRDEAPIAANEGERTLPLIGAAARRFGRGERVTQASARPRAERRPSRSSPHGPNPDSDLNTRRNPLPSEGRLFGVDAGPSLRRSSSQGHVGLIPRCILHCIPGPYDEVHAVIGHPNSLGRRRRLGGRRRQRFRHRRRSDRFCVSAAAATRVHEREPNRHATPGLHAGPHRHTVAVRFRGMARSASRWSGQSGFERSIRLGDGLLAVRGRRDRFGARPPRFVQLVQSRFRREGLAASRQPLAWSVQARRCVERAKRIGKRDTAGCHWCLPDLRFR